jgi:hypothetical protein
MRASTVTAGSEAMLMIQRLQREKVATQMEVRQSMPRAAPTRSARSMRTSPPLTTLVSSPMASTQTQDSFTNEDEKS